MKSPLLTMNLYFKILQKLMLNLTKGNKFMAAYYSIACSVQLLWLPACTIELKCNDLGTKTALSSARQPDELLLFS